jgi:hypothetical protein
VGTLSGDDFDKIAQETFNKMDTAFDFAILSKISDILNFDCLDYTAYYAKIIYDILNFDREKILVQRIRNPQLKTRLVCAFDENCYINGTGLSNILLRDKVKDSSLKFLVALLNSSLINYWFSYYFIDVNIKPEQLRKIPVKIPYDPRIFVNLVDKILIARNADPNADISKLEKQIDELVYKLYDLTEEEIKIVEGK